MERLIADDLPPGLRRFLFHGGALRAIVGGQSALDLPRLHVADRGAARRFLARYGYDLSEPQHIKDIERVRHEALGFIRGVLCHDIGLDVPTLYDTIHILDLLLLASNRKVNTPADKLNQAWACSVLRVMHTVAHADNYFQQNYYWQIREAVIERFVAQVRTLENGSQVLAGGNYDVPLMRFEVKQQKPLRSVVLKLLQKQENVATDLFDHIGVRMIVRRPIDALFAVRELHEQNTIVYANVKPTRSHNTLVDINGYAEKARRLIGQWRAGAIDEQAAVAMLAAFDRRPEQAEGLAWNPHSSHRYNALQFTCRQMIRVANPLYQRLVKARKLARREMNGDGLTEMLDSLSLVGVEPEIRFFFPYEVQIMDVAAYDQATAGRASYRDYKQRQVDTVRDRVLAGVLTLQDLDATPRQAPIPMAPRALARLNKRP